MIVGICYLCGTTDKLVVLQVGLGSLPNPLHQMFSLNNITGEFIF